MSIFSGVDSLIAEIDEAALNKDLTAQKEFARVTIPLPWIRLSERTRALKPGCVFLIGGPTKVGKSYFVYNILLSLFNEGYPWKYLPLEDSRKDHIWRLLACLCRDYRAGEDEPGTVDFRTDAIDLYRESLFDLATNIAENPRHGKKDKQGRTVVPPLPWQKVLQWIRDMAMGNRVVVVDPIAQIEFGGRKPWEEEDKFIREVLAVASDSDATIIVVGHCVKRPGAAASLPLSEGDFQGSANWTRLCHAVLLIDGHEPKTSPIRKMGGDPAEEEHNRTVYISAARNGSGTRQRVAFNQSKDGPFFEEVGVIAPKAKKGKGES